MPYYQVIIKLTNGEMHKVIRENKNMYLDKVYLEFNLRACQYFKGENIEEVIVAGINQNSKEFRDHKASQVNPDPSSQEKFPEQLGEPEPVLEE